MPTAQIPSKEVLCDIWIKYSNMLAHLTVRVGQTNITNSIRNKMVPEHYDKVYQRKNSMQTMSTII